MSFLVDITVLILTFNEEANIGRTLAILREFPCVVVLDSGSTDRTIEIVKSYPNTRVFGRPFDQHAHQWNYGLENTGIQTSWVLALDADYVLSPEFIIELAVLKPKDETVGFRANFRYCIDGKALRGNLYPAHVVLFRRADARYFQDGHTQRLKLNGIISDIRSKIDHDDRKPLARWLASQQRYAVLEADHILSTNVNELRRIERLRRLGWLTPPLIMLYVMFWKGCIFDGWAGLYYVWQRTLAETLIALEILDRRLSASKAPAPDR